MSIVYYKFKSAKDYDTVTFDGTGIVVFDLKREIMVTKKLGHGKDFDLTVFNAQSNEGTCRVLFAPFLPASRVWPSS